MGRVQDQVAVVTGAANGLGQAIAIRLAEEGALLVLGDIDEEGLERTAGEIGAAASTMLGDVTEEANARRLIEHASVPLATNDSQQAYLMRICRHGQESEDPAGARGSG